MGLTAPAASRLVPFAVALALAASAGDALADYQQTSTVGNVTVTFRGEATEQGIRDVDAVKAAFDTAAAKSKDMQAKVKDAGSKFGNTLTVKVVRNDPGVAVGQWQVENLTTPPSHLKRGTDTILVDVGDIEKYKTHLTSEKTDPGKADDDKNKVVDSILISVLAHEVEHSRDGGTETDSRKWKHSDPPVPPVPGTTDTGPQVDDENKVQSELGSGVKRLAYRTVERNPKLHSIPYAVNGQKVTLALTALKEDLQTEKKGEFGATEFSVDPDVHESVPDQPCSGTPGEEPCYPRRCGAGTSDTDCDGIDDAADNCPGLSNPQQADRNQDGVGQGCDIREPFIICDIDRDSDVDQSDVDAIFRARGRRASPGDPRDADGDGLITVNDARLCVLLCTKPGCKP